VADTSGVPFVITDRCFIPRERYFDRGFFELEHEKLWPRVWQMACRLEEIPHVGDYVEYWVADYSVVVVRTGPDLVKAYQNACRHRATQLAMGCGSFRGGQIVCPFHGWRWNLDGTPAGLYGREGFDERCLQPEDIKLIECQVDTWANCVFINMDPHAEPLREALAPLPQMLDPLNVSSMYVRWWRGARLKANWKLAMEAFMEGLHNMQTHPQLTMGAKDYPADQLQYFSHPNGHMHFISTNGGDILTAAGRAAGLTEAEAGIEFNRIMCEGLDSMILPKDLHVIEGLRNLECEPGRFPEKLMEALYAWNIGAGISFPAPDPEALGRWGGDFFAFPNFFILPLYGNALLYRSRPDSDDPEHCFFELWSATLYPEGQEPGKPKLEEHSPDDEAWPLIPRQDFSNIERQQRGLHSSGLKAIRLSAQYEHGIANMHAHLDTYLAG
jgi:nitrite reductase/ring-hydroxylating ferredoxin subunit